MEDPLEYDVSDRCDSCGKLELIANWSSICYKCRGTAPRPSNSCPPPNEDPFSEDEIDPAQVNEAVIDYDASHKQKSPKVKKEESQTAPPMLPMSLRSAASYIAHNYSRKIPFLDYNLMSEEIHKALLEHNWSEEVKTSGDMWEDSSSEPPSRGPLIARVWQILHPWEEGKYEEWTDDGVFAENMIKIIIWYVVLFRMATYVEPQKP